MASSSRHREDSWQPLPQSKIFYGFAVHAFLPAANSAVHQQSAESSSARARGERLDFSLHMVDLEVGDEVYAFERFVPMKGEEAGAWFRGYVVSSSNRSLHSTSLDPSSSKPLAQPEPTVTLGIFPASFCHIREELGGNLTSAASNQASISRQQKGKGRAKVLDALREEEEEEGDGQADGQTNSRKSCLQDDRDRERSKPSPPIPSLKAGDDTVRGVEEPLVDEIASALREWHSRLYHHLLFQNYALFHTVRRHIHFLHSARRQLLDVHQTLGSEEIIRLRQECISRLVQGNVAQNLEVIVRHPSGGLATTKGVDSDGEAVDEKSWVSGIELYSMQVASAYVNEASLPSSFSANPSSSTIARTGSAPSYSTSHSRSISRSDYGHSLARSMSISASTPNLALSKTSSSSKPSSIPNQTQSSPSVPPSGEFHHLFLELRACVANVCASSESCELFFSLYSKPAAQFVTEEFLVVIDDHGRPIRSTRKGEGGEAVAEIRAGGEGGEGGLTRVKALIVDLADQDVVDLVLVCRVVRCGALKMAEIGGGRSLTASPSSSPRPGTPSQSSAASYRRPVGCAVLHLNHHVQFSVDDPTSKPTDASMPIYVPVEEGAFAGLHEDIIHGRTALYTRSNRVDRIAVDLKPFFGQSNIVIKDHPALLLDVPIVQRLTFPDAVFPGQSRNDIYVKLWSGDFQPPSSSIRIRRNMSTFGVGSSSSTLGGSYQVNLEVRTRDGIVLKAAICRGAGEPPIREFASTVFHKSNNPRFGELVKISNIDIQQLPRTHLFFTFRNRSSSKEKDTTLDSFGLEKPFAFAYLPLFPGEGAAFVPDGDHRLVLYRTDKIHLLSPTQYFDLPSTLPSDTSTDAIRIPQTLRSSLHPIRDSVVIRSFLCSTSFTQSPILLRLLSWEKSGLLNDEAGLLEVLTQLPFASEFELAKTIKPTLDALLVILDRNPGGHAQVEEAAFDALVVVITLAQDRRFSNFKPVLEIYIEQNLALGSVWVNLISAMTRLLGDQTSKQLRAAIKNWSWIFRLIDRSRSIQKQKDIGMGTATSLTNHLDRKFVDSLSSLLDSFKELMRLRDPASIGTQVLTLQHFSEILPGLTRTFDAPQLAKIIISFADSASLTGKSTIFQLLFYLQAAQSVVFQDAEARLLLVPSLIRWIKPYVGRFEEDPLMDGDAAILLWMERLRLSISIAAEMVDRLSRAVAFSGGGVGKEEVLQEMDHLELLFSALFPKLLEAYHDLNDTPTLEFIDRHRSLSTLNQHPVPTIFPASYPFPFVASLPRKGDGSPSLGKGLNLLLGEIAAVLVSLVAVQPGKTLRGWLEESMEIDGQDATNQILLSFFLAAGSIIDNEPFPSSWLSSTLLALTSTLKFLVELLPFMVQHNIPPCSESSSFDLLLWKSYVHTIFEVVASPHLAIEAQTAQKRRTVWRLALDLRATGASLLDGLWTALGLGESTSADDNYQIRFLGIVQDVLGLCLLSHHEGLRDVGIKILYSFIVSTYEIRGNFQEVKTEIMERLNHIFQTGGQGDEFGRSCFVASLRNVFASSESVPAELREMVFSFLESIDQFLSLLLAVRNLPHGGFDDDRLAYQLRLLDFIQQMSEPGERSELYIEYVQSLVQSHASNGDYIEAGLALQLHSRLYEWKQDVFVEPFCQGEIDLASQSEFGRKESLLLQILDYWTRGKAFELAIRVCEELEAQHATKTFDYLRLSELLAHRLRLVASIMTEPRSAPQYFYVAYYGKSFPTALLSHRFVYRGSDWEKVSGFSDRLLSKHPSALIINSPIILDDLLEKEDMVIQVLAVSPEPEREGVAVFEPDVPREISAWYESNDVNRFSYSRSIVPNGLEGADLVNVVLEKTFLMTEEYFPTVLKRSEIVQTEIVIISALDAALADVSQKTKELKTLEKKYRLLAKSGDSTLNTNPLSMTLNGVVDAPLNGGIPLYRSAFLISDYASNHPEDEDKINQLQSAVDAQVIVIIELLGLHGRICPASMLPFHESLLNFFAKNFAPELDRLTLPLSSSRSLAFPPISRINSPPSAPVLSPKLTPTSNPQPLPPLTNTQTNGSTSALARLTSPFGSFNNASASNSRFQPHGGSSSHNSAHARPNSHASGGGGGRAPRPSLGSMFSSGSGGRSDQQQRSESPIGKLGTTGGGAGRSSPLRWNGGRETQSDVGHGSGIGSEGGGLLERFQSVRKGR